MIYFLITVIISILIILSNTKPIFYALEILREQLTPMAKYKFWSHFICVLLIGSIIPFFNITFACSMLNLTTGDYVRFMIGHEE